MNRFIMFSCISNIELAHIYQMFERRKTLEISLSTLELWAKLISAKEAKQAKPREIWDWIAHTRAHERNESQQHWKKRKSPRQISFFASFDLSCPPLPLSWSWICFYMKSGKISLNAEKNMLAPPSRYHI